MTTPAHAGRMLLVNIPVAHIGHRVRGRPGTQVVRRAGRGGHRAGSPAGLRVAGLSGCPGRFSVDPGHRPCPAWNPAPAFRSGKPQQQVPRRYAQPLPRFRPQAETWRAGRHPRSAHPGNLRQFGSSWLSGELISSTSANLPTARIWARTSPGYGVDVVGEPLKEVGGFGVQPGEPVWPLVGGGTHHLLVGRVVIGFPGRPT